MCLPAAVVAKFTLKDMSNKKEWEACKSRTVMCDGNKETVAQLKSLPSDAPLAADRDTSNCVRWAEEGGCMWTNGWAEWMQVNCATSCSARPECAHTADARPLDASKCTFSMITGDKVMGTYDMHGTAGNIPAGEPGSVGDNPLGGATFQVRSGFGSSSAARANVPLYSMESFDLKTYKGVTNPPVAELSLGGAGYNCTQEYYDASTEPKGCKGYALASNTPWPLLFYTCATYVPLCLLFNRFAGPKININAWLNGEDETWEGFNKGRPLGGSPRSDDAATTLANLQPKQVHTDANGKEVNVTALCLKNKMHANATSHYSNNTEVWLAFSTRVAPVSAFKDTAGMFWQIYTSEQGVLPYVEIAGQKVINASYFTVPFINTFTKVDLTPVFFKDETLGTKSMLDKKLMTYFAEEFEQTGYFSHPDNIKFDTNTNNLNDAWAENYIALTFRHFTRRVHVRYKTVSEIWAEIGALWAGAMIFMSLFFTQSGTTDVKSKKPMMVFNPPILAGLPIIGKMISKARVKHITKNEDDLKAALAAVAAEDIELKTVA
jgi:hypothetical protein